MEKKLTIIIPVYNEEKTLLELLKQVNFLKTDHGAEIILINDGSEDSSKNIIEKNFQHKGKIIPKALII